MSSRGPWFVALSVVSLTSQVTAQTTQPNEQTEQTECPEVLRGASLTLRELPGGVALTFTARTKKQVAELHELVYAAAAFIEYRSKLGEIHPEAKLAYDDAPVPPVDIDVKDAKTRIDATIRAEDAEDRTAVIALAKRFKKHWDESGCASGSFPVPVSRAAP